MLLYRSRDFQLFGYTPRGHRNGRQQAVGATVRVRRRRRWRWLQVRVYWPRRDLRIGRGAVAVEATSWLTDHRNERVTVKVFVRLKLGLGGGKATHLESAN